MQLGLKGTEFVGRQMRIALTDKATDEPYPVRLNEDGSYLHKFRGNKAFMAALESFEKLTAVEGKPIREVWLSALKEHLARTAV